MRRNKDNAMNTVVSQLHTTCLLCPRQHIAGYRRSLTESQRVQYVWQNG